MGYFIQKMDSLSWADAVPVHGNERAVLLALANGTDEHGRGSLITASVLVGASLPTEEFREALKDLVDEKIIIDTGCGDFMLRLHVDPKSLGVSGGTKNGKNTNH